MRMFPASVRLAYLSLSDLLALKCEMDNWLTDNERKLKREPDNTDLAKKVKTVFNRHSLIDKAYNERIEQLFED